MALGAFCSTLQAWGTVQTRMHTAWDVTCKGAAAGEMEAEHNEVISPRSQFHLQAQKQLSANMPRYTSLINSSLDLLWAYWQWFDALRL